MPQLLLHLALLAALAGHGCVFDTTSVGGARDGGTGGSSGAGGLGGSAGGAAGGGGGGVGGAGNGGECTPGTEDVDCPFTSCNPTTLMCSRFEPRSRGVCETCNNDIDCESEQQRCVEVFYRGGRFPNLITGYCLQISQTPDGADCESPYTTLLADRPSLSGGDDESYCGIQEDFTTCDAMFAFSGGQICSSGQDEDCPIGGLCREITEIFVPTWRCTYACDDDSQCARPFTQPQCGGFCGAD